MTPSSETNSVTTILPICRDSVGLQRRATWLVLLREAKQEGMELVALRPAERRKELVLDLARECAQAPQLPLALGGELDEMTATVLRVPPTFQQALLLELVEQPDQLTPVVAEHVGDGPLRLVRAGLEGDQNGEVVGVEPLALIGRKRALLGRIAEALEQEGARRHQLGWQQARGPGGRSGDAHAKESSAFNR